MRALVTGVSGQLGWYLASLLQADGVEVWGLVPPQSGVHLPGGGETALVARTLPFVQTVAGDVLDPWSLLRALESSHPDVVFALGAVSQPGLAPALPELLLQINAMGVVRLLEAMRHVVPTARCVHVSSDAIFGEDGGVQTEDTPIRPVTHYGLSKAMAHLAVQVARARGQWAANAVLYNATSPRQVTGLIPAMVKGVLEVADDPLNKRLVSPPMTLARDWMFAGDAARAFVMCSKQEAPTDVLVASGQGYTVEELLGTMFAAVLPHYLALGQPGWRSLVEVKGEHVGGTPHPDISLLREWGWTPTVTFKTLVTWLISIAGVWTEETAPESAMWPSEVTAPWRP